MSIDAMWYVRMYVHFHNVYFYKRICCQFIIDDTKEGICHSQIVCNDSWYISIKGRKRFFQGRYIFHVRGMNRSGKLVVISNRLWIIRYEPAFHNNFAKCSSGVEAVNVDSLILITYSEKWHEQFFCQRNSIFSIIISK